MVFSSTSVRCRESAGEHVAGKPEHAYAMGDAAKNQQVKLPSYLTPDAQEGCEYAPAHPLQLQ